jgi:hypothetical protein
VLLQIYRWYDVSTCKEARKLEVKIDILECLGPGRRGCPIAKTGDFPPYPMGNFWIIGVIFMKYKTSFCFGLYFNLLLYS